MISGAVSFGTEPRGKIRLARRLKWKPLKILELMNTYLYACPRCSALVVYDGIAQHRKWHAASQELARKLTGESDPDE